MRRSQHDAGELSWSVVGVPLGAAGLDLRQAVEPPALDELLNARFDNERTLKAREGHRGFTVRDGGTYPALGNSLPVTDEWVYGHGLLVDPVAAGSAETTHWPVPGRARGVFRLNGTDVVWTGDRLLVANGGGSAFGYSSFWSRTANTALNHGIPAHLPVQTDSHPPGFTDGYFAETCLTETLRGIAQTASGGLLYATVVDRATGTVVAQTEVSGASNDPMEPRIVNSGGTIVLLWRDNTSKTMYLVYWTGLAWSTPSVVHTDVYGFDVVPDDGGFHLMWREGAPSTSALYIGRYYGTVAKDTPYAFRTALNLTGVSALDGPFAFDVSPADRIGVVLANTTLKARVFNPDGSAISGIAWTSIDAGTTWDFGLSIKSRGLAGSNGHHDWVVHGSGGNTSIHQFGVNPGVGLVQDTASQVRYNTQLASQSFRVGDEVFCWLRSWKTSNTNFLVAGVAAAQVCGVSDQEEGQPGVTLSGRYSAPLPAVDPLGDGTKWTWCRLYNTGQSYARGGNSRIGDMDFVPRLSAVQFGRSVYLAGSLVRNFDGTVLGDAGWHDYPKVATTPTQGTGGSMTLTGTYYFRVYPVRYNLQGERFMGDALTYGPVTLTGSNNKVTLSIYTVPSTNHSDVQLEVYRTEAGGTAFYLDGVVANSLAASTVSYVSSRADRSTPLVTTDLVEQPGDTHAAGVGQLSEVTEWGPVGCAFLAVSGDRLWGAGGQVPPGTVQFSKLHEPGEGAGFDALNSTQEIDTEGGVITSIGRINDVTVALQRDRVTALGGLGPDNYGRGTFDGPQSVAADGATTSAGTVLTQAGLAFWGADGPRVLRGNFQVDNVCTPVAPLTAGITPTGVRVDLSNMEVVWYSESGDAVLLNYMTERPRWARWSGLPVAGATADSLVTPAGRLLLPDTESYLDDGHPFDFKWAMGRLRADQVAQGATQLRAVGVTGVHLADHELRLRVFYEGSPLWTDSWTWQPVTGTWLGSGDDLAGLTAAQIDALTTTDRSGAYLTHKRVSRGGCHHFRVEASTTINGGPAYAPHELSMEVGVGLGMGRVPVATFGG